MKVHSTGSEISGLVAQSGPSAPDRRSAESLGYMNFLYRTSVLSFVHGITRSLIIHTPQPVVSFNICLITRDSKTTNVTWGVISAHVDLIRRCNCGVDVGLSALATDCPGNPSPDKTQVPPSPLQRLLPQL